MLLGEFIERVQADLERYSVANMCGDRYIFMKIASWQCRDKIHNIVQAIGNPGQSQDAVAYNLREFTEFLRTRWELLRLTDMNYCHCPHEPSTILCLSLATHLAEALGGHAYDYLMPGIRNITTWKGNIYSLELWQFIYADPLASCMPVPKSARSLTADDIRRQQLGDPIDVYGCFQQAQNQFLVRVEAVRNVKINLTSDEEERARAHSSCTDQLFMKIKSSDPNDRNKMLDQLKRLLSDPSYDVGSTYGNDGKTRLRTVIMSDYQTRDSLIGLMVDVIPSRNWLDFLDALDIDDLKKIVVGAANLSIISVASDHSCFTTNTDKNAALLFCLAYIYKYNRSEKHGRTYKPSYIGSSIFGGAISGLGNAYTCDEKVSACKLMLDYLVYHHMFNTIDDMFVKLRLLHKHYVEAAPLPSNLISSYQRGFLDGIMRNYLNNPDNRARCIGAAEDGDLGVLFASAKEHVHVQSVQSQPAAGGSSCSLSFKAGS